MRLPDKESTLLDDLGINFCESFLLIIPSDSKEHTRNATTETANYRITSMALEIG